MRMKMLLFVGLLLLGIIGVIASVVMLVSAVRFMEWGRVLLYFVTMVISGEVLIWSALKLRKPKT